MGFRGEFAPDDPDARQRLDQARDGRFCALSAPHTIEHSLELASSLPSRFGGGEVSPFRVVTLLGHPLPDRARRTQVAAKLLHVHNYERNQNET